MRRYAKIRATLSPNSDLKVIHITTILRPRTGDARGRSAEGGIYRFAHCLIWENMRAAMARAYTPSPRVYPQLAPVYYWLGINAD